MLRGMKLNTAELERVASLFRAFAEPTRLAILQELKAGERSVSEIVDSLHTSQANVSKQLKQLFDAGVVSRRKQGTQVIYGIADEMIFELCRMVCEKLNRDAVKPVELQF
jgi:DNA-binding transcriptional ArsR family regulator